MADKEIKVERTYDWYSSEVNGWGSACYYGLVTQEYRKAMELTPEICFEDFDDAFLKELAGIKQDEPLPLKSNEVFDEDYWSQLVRWYYLPSNSCNSIHDGVLSFMRHVKSGKLEPYKDYYEREYPFTRMKARNTMNRLAGELLLNIFDDSMTPDDVKTKTEKLVEMLHQMMLDDDPGYSTEILWTDGKKYKFTTHSDGLHVTAPNGEQVYPI